MTSKIQRLNYIAKLELDKMCAEYENFVGEIAIRDASPEEIKKYGIRCVGKLACGDIYIMFNEDVYYSKALTYVAGVKYKIKKQDSNFYYLSNGEKVARVVHSKEYIIGEIAKAG